MGRLAGLRYREIVKRLKESGFRFDRQGAGSREIGHNPTTNRYTTVPNHPGVRRKEKISRRCIQEALAFSLFCGCVS